jgi:NAD(P)-dependent dehydrogenase (short-subunit alcohol dehydrogenase family)
VEANLLGPILVTRAFLPLLEKSPGFRVAFVASASGYLPLPMAASYAATKWGVRGLAVSLEEEFRIRGFGGRRVLVVCPSYISTGLFAGASAPFLTPILEVGSVARGIARALRHDARVLDMPWSVHLLKFLARVLPIRGIARSFGSPASPRAWRDGPGAGDTRVIAMSECFFA